MYCNESLKKYLDDLAARSPAPGGGSACAFSAALAASLLSMVANFTIGKPKYAEWETEIKLSLEKSEKLRRELLMLTDLDVVAYQSKDIRDSLNVPFMVARLCYEGMKLCPALLRKGNINLISDVGVAAAIFESAFFSAYMNVDINLKVLNEKSFASMVRKELDRKAKSMKKIREKTEVYVGKIIRG